MRTIQDTVREVLEGSRSADTITVWAWRDNQLVYPEPLDVADWDFTESAEDNVKVNQTVRLQVMDPDGVLGAWKLDDPLGTAGTQLQIIYNVGDTGSVNYGKFRITENEPEEHVEWRKVFVPGYDEPDSDEAPHFRWVPIVTAAVRLTAVDLTDYIDADKLEAPESPTAGATALGDFKRLIGDYFPVVVDAGVPDVTLPRLLVYERERLDNCQDLLARVGARYRMGGDGEMHIYVPSATPVLRIEPGRGLISVARKQSSVGLKNRWVVEGKDGITGFPLLASVQLTTGALRYGGPHGRAQEFYTSEMITTGTQAINYAETLRNQALSKLSIELEASILPHPELQGGDRVEIGYPVQGKVVYLSGIITRVRSSGNPLPRGTQITVRCNYEQVISALGTTPWTQYLTGNVPPLPWD